FFYYGRRLFRGGFCAENHLKIQKKDHSSPNKGRRGRVTRDETPRSPQIFLHDVCKLFKRQTALVFQHYMLP
ncbi:hypothetical protein, partial [Bacteroides pyogenes]|uniref:hypothetical protein n=1 Tax=Bacteroides pyogenes TaxID=310300 RepID=UPI001BA9FE6A